MKLATPLEKSLNEIKAALRVHLEMEQNTEGWLEVHWYVQSNHLHGILHRQREKTLLNKAKENYPDVGMLIEASEDSSLKKSMSDTFKALEELAHRLTYLRGEWLGNYQLEGKTYDAWSTCDTPTLKEIHKVEGRFEIGKVTMSNA